MQESPDPARPRNGTSVRSGIRTVLVTRIARPALLAVAFFAGLTSLSTEPLLPMPTVAMAPYIFPQDVGIGDFDSDGVSDLVVASQSGGAVSVFLGKGDGTSGPERRITVGISQQNIVTADFNRDGRLDVAAAYAGGGVRGEGGTTLTKGTAASTPPDGKGFFCLIQSRDAIGHKGYGTVTAPNPREPLFCSEGCPRDSARFYSWRQGLPWVKT